MIRGLYDSGVRFLATVTDQLERWIS
jgi:hypothetical protein